MNDPRLAALADQIVDVRCALRDCASSVVGEGIRIMRPELFIYAKECVERAFELACSLHAESETSDRHAHSVVKRILGQ